MIQIQRCQLLQLCLILVAIGLYDVLKEFFHLWDVIHEDLDQILNPHPLFLFKFIMLILITGEFLLLPVFNQCADDVSNQILQLIKQSLLAHIEQRKSPLSLLVSRLCYRLK